MKYYRDRDELKVVPGEETKLTYLEKTLQKPVVNKQVVQKKPGPAVNALNNVRKPLPRKENLSERIERITYEYGEAGMKKPAHYDNPNIVDDENWKQRPRPFDNQDSSTFPSDRDQRQRMSTWDMLMESSKTNPKERRELKNIIWDDYKKNGPKYMGDDELKMIGKHPEQIKKQYEETKLPVFEPPSKAVVRQEPEIPLEEQIKIRADARLAREQREYDKTYGTGGIVRIWRPQ